MCIYSKCFVPPVHHSQGSWCQRLELPASAHLSHPLSGWWSSQWAADVCCQSLAGHDWRCHTRWQKCHLCVQKRAMCQRGLFHHIRSMDVIYCILQKWREKNKETKLVWGGLGKEEEKGMRQAEKWWWGGRGGGGGGGGEKDRQRQMDRQTYR